MTQGNGDTSAKLTARLAAGGIVGPILFLIAFVVAGLLRPGYSPIRHAVSDLGVGPNAWLLNGAGILNCLLLWGWVVAFVRRTRSLLSNAWRWAAGVSLALPPLGYAIASIFTEARATLTVHTYVGAVLALLVPIPVFFIAWLALKRIEAWRVWSVYTLAASLATLALVGLMLWIWGPSSPPGASHFEGLIERIVIVETLAWYVFAGWQITRRDSIVGS